MLERFAAKITRKDRIPVYRERANYHRQRAIIDSIRNGVLDFLDNKTIGIELVDPISTLALTIPGKDQALEFAFDKNGLAFARIEGGKYYPISLEDSERHLKIASHYDKEASSTIRRIAVAPSEEFDDALFGLTVGINNGNDMITKLIIKFHKKLERLEKEL